MTGCSVSRPTSQPTTWDATKTLGTSSEAAGTRTPRPRCSRRGTCRRPLIAVGGGERWNTQMPELCYRSRMVHPAGSESSVVVVGLQEVMVVTDGDDLAVIEHDDLVRGMHGGEPVCNGHQGALVGCLVDRP